MTKKVTETKYGGYMENEKTKVELEDIVGLVQTDDPTNSVQLKKEAQLSICEKRLIELEKENEQLKEQREKLFIRERDTKNRWRELKQENEQLKQELFESEKECIMIDYRDNPIRRNDKIIDLKEEYKERFGRDFE